MRKLEDNVTELKPVLDLNHDFTVFFNLMTAFYCGSHFNVECLMQKKVLKDAYTTLPT